MLDPLSLATGAKKRLMFKTELALKSTPNEETQSTESTKRQPNFKVAVIAGSAILIIIAIIVTVVLSQGDVSQSATITPQPVSQHTGPRNNSRWEPGQLVTSPLHPLAKLVKAHPVPSIIALVGLLTIIGVAITLAIVLSRPGEQVEVKNVVPGENELDQGGEGSFWQRSMWPLIFSILVLLLFIILFIIWFIKGRPPLWSAKASSKTKIPEPTVEENLNVLIPKASSKTKLPEPTVEEKLNVLIPKWNVLSDVDIGDSIQTADGVLAVKNKIKENVILLNKIAALKVPNIPEEKNLSEATLTVPMSDSKSYDYNIQYILSTDLYVGLYLSVKPKDIDFTDDYVILLDPNNNDKFNAVRVDSFLLKEKIEDYLSTYNMINDHFQNLKNFENRDNV
jgi:hypothetical protein